MCKTVLPVCVLVFVLICTLCIGSRVCCVMTVHLYASQAMLMHMCED